MKIAVLILFLLASCGYHFQEPHSADGPITISIPNIKGDLDGRMNTEIAQVIANSSHFRYQQNGGAMRLEVAVVHDGSDRIGYRYDRSPVSGKRRKNIVGVENRRNLTVEVKLIDTYTEEVVIGPVLVKAKADYDYIDSNSIQDLTFINSRGVAETVINFSLGQLDSVDGAHDDTGAWVYRQLAQKIVDGLVSQECITSP